MLLLYFNQIAAALVNIDDLLYNINTIVTNSFLFLGQYMRQETKWKRESGTGLEKVLEPWLRSLSKTIFCNGSARKVLFSMLLTINWVGLGPWNLVGARHMLCRAGELRLYILFHGCVLQTGKVLDRPVTGSLVIVDVIMVAAVTHKHIYKHISH